MNIQFLIIAKQQVACFGESRNSNNVKTKTDKHLIKFWNKWKQQNY